MREIVCVDDAVAVKLVETDSDAVTESDRDNDALVEIEDEIVDVVDTVLDCDWVVV